MNTNQKTYIYNHQFPVLNRTCPPVIKKDKDILLTLKNKKEKLYHNLDEIECFLNKTSSCLKLFKIYSIFK